MSKSDTLDELIIRWEDLGRPSPEEVCKESPAQLEAFREAVRDIEEMECFLKSFDSTLHFGKKCQDLSSDEKELENRSTISEYLKSDGKSDWESTKEQSTRQLGRFRLIRCVGKGGFGEVWQAHHPDLNKMVAIKRPRKDRRFSKDQLHQFRNEAEKVAQLRHPAIIPVLDVERDGDGWFFVSEFIDGESLCQRLASGPIPVEEAVPLVARIADALALAHRKRLVHRDVKPSNILVNNNGEPFLSDFGLALSEDEQSRESRSMAGTIPYMSPEQLRGKNQLLDGRTDIYSLGVVLYECLSGEHPFKGKSQTALYEQILYKEVRPLRMINEAIPKELDRICSKCLEKEVGKRYRTCADLAEDLRNSLQRSKSNWFMTCCTTAGLILAVTACSVAIFFGGLDFRPPSPKIEATQPTSSINVIPNELLSGKTYHLFRFNPKLISASDKDDLPYIHAPIKEQLTVVAKMNTVIQLAHIESTSYTFRIDIETQKWNNSFYVFMGRHAMPNNPSRSFSQGIRIRSMKKNGNPTTIITRQMTAENTDSGNVRTPYRQCSEYLTRTKPIRHHLRIEVKQSQLILIEWDGASLDMLVTEQENKAYPPVFYMGAFGIHVEDESIVVFRNAILTIQ